MPVLNAYQKAYYYAINQAKKQDSNKYADQFEAQLKAEKIRALFTPEYKFHPDRKWRIDWALVKVKLAIELNGGVHARAVRCNHCGSAVTRTLNTGAVVSVREGGRHNSAGGYVKDLEKLNALCIAGWRVLQFTSETIISGDAVSQVVALLKNTYGDLLGDIG